MPGEGAFASGSLFSSDWLPDPPKHLAFISLSSRMLSSGLPWGLSRESACQGVQGDGVQDPDLGRSPHTAAQLSLHTTTFGACALLKPASPRAHARQQEKPQQ